MRRITVWAPLVGGLVTLGSCSFLNMSDRPVRVQDLVGWVECVHVESELAKQKVRTATALLVDLANGDFKGPAVEIYQQFVTALEESEAQAGTLRNTVAPMKRSAGPVFDQWQKDLAQIANPTLRKRNEERRVATQARYQDVARTVDPAQAAFDALNRALRDHALFLGNDFNAASVAVVREDVDNLQRLAGDLAGRFDTCLRAAQDYVNACSLPVSATPPASPGDPATGTTRR